MRSKLPYGGGWEDLAEASARLAPVRRQSSTTPIFASESRPGGRRAVHVSESNAARELHPNERAYTMIRPPRPSFLTSRGPRLGRVVAALGSTPPATRIASRTHARRFIGDLRSRHKIVLTVRGLVPWGPVVVKSKYQLVPVPTVPTVPPGERSGMIPVMAIETQSDLYISRSDLHLNQTAP